MDFSALQTQIIGGLYTLLVVLILAASAFVAIVIYRQAQRRRLYTDELNQYPDDTEIPERFKERPIEW